MNIGRTALLAWANSVAASQYPSIDMLGDGIVYCHIVHRSWPKAIPIKRVNFTPNSFQDKENNIELLLLAFSKAGLKYNIDKNKITNNEFNANFQLLTFLWNNTKSLSTDYDASLIREKIMKFGSDKNPYLIDCERPTSNIVSFLKLKVDSLSTVADEVKRLTQERDLLRNALLECEAGINQAPEGSKELVKALKEILGETTEYFEDDAHFSPIPQTPTIPFGDTNAVEVEIQSTNSVNDENTTNTPDIHPISDSE